MKWDKGIDNIVTGPVIRTDLESGLKELICNGPVADFNLIGPLVYK